MSKRRCRKSSATPAEDGTDGSPVATRRRMNSCSIPCRPSLGLLSGRCLGALWLVLIAAIFLGAKGEEIDRCKACYITEGREGLVITYELTKDACAKCFSFIVNVLDPQVHTHHCSGVLTAPDTVVVPASCVDARHRPSGRDVFPLVRTGSFDLNNHDGPEPEEVTGVCEVIIHKAYDSDPKHGHDVAVLKLRTNLTVHAPITKVTSINDCPDANLSALGFFTHSRDGPPAFKLEVLPFLQRVPVGECEAKMGSMPGRFCTIAKVSTNPVWDLGSPMLCNDKSLVGLASYTHSQMHDEHWPIVYSSAVDLFDWVKGIPGGNARVKRNPDEECRHFWDPDVPQDSDGSQIPNAHIDL